MRKAFNFFVSYYDVYNLLKTDKEKLLFIDALLKRQFEGVEPNIDKLTGQSGFAYMSQKFNIDRQVKGWEDKKGEPLLLHPTDGGVVTPTEQVQEKEEEKGKEEEVPKKKSLNIKNWIKWFNNQKKLYTGTIGKFKVLTNTDENNLKKLLESYVQEDFETAIKNLFVSKWAIENNMLTPSHFLRVENFNKYLNQVVQVKKLNTFG